jgi:signal transduction histidine kinase
MPGKSVSLRLIIAAVVWIAAALVIIGLVLSIMFRSQVERAFDLSLHDHVEELLAMIAVDAAGQVSLRRHPADPRFNKPLSGSYWVVRLSKDRLEHSRSLWQHTLDLPSNPPGEEAASFPLTGPRGEPLRAVGRTFTLPDVAEPIAVFITAPAAEIEAAVRRFTNIVTAAMGLLGLGLIAAVVLQVRYGLRPLARMRETLASIRAGRETRLEGPFPTEIEPLANELNALLDHSGAVVERARTQAGNLAHALKTPLAVLTNEADRRADDSADLIRDQCDLMARHIDRHLSRARAAGARGVLGAHADIHPVADGLRRTMARIHADRGLDISLHGTEGAVFRGERQDLEEMLGNLMDNACKWAAGMVRVSVAPTDAGRSLCLDVDDDGPGIPGASMATVTDRGRRLDENKPGSGLGLSIVREIAELYSGTLDLEPSPMGGLRATLRLPAD